nr:MAG TPA: hypothetical protein [Caudoviricetes sp.]
MRVLRRVSSWFISYKKRNKSLNYDFGISEYTKSMQSSYCHSIGSLSLDRKSINLDLSV